MSAAKRIPKDWRSHETKAKGGGLKPTTPIRVDAKTADDLPQLMTTKEAADKLRCHYKTVEELRKTRAMKFMKLGSRYYTTVEWVAEYIEVESRR